MLRVSACIVLLVATNTLSDPCVPPLSACEENPCNNPAVDAREGWYCAKRDKRCNSTLLSLKHSHKRIRAPATIDEARVAEQRCELMAADPWKTFKQYANGEQRIKSRADFPWLLAASGIRGKAVEIGVAEGGFSTMMLRGWEGCTAYHQIDPWGDDAASKNRAQSHEITMISLDASLAAYCQVVTEFAGSKYGGKVHQHRMGAEVAAKKFRNESLAFIYIDGNHYYNWVKADISNYWPKLKPGGLMAGHDFFWPVSGDGWTADGGVRRAVEEFAETEGLKVHLTNKVAFPACCPSWYVFKPPASEYNAHKGKGRNDLVLAKEPGQASECRQRSP